MAILFFIMLATFIGAVIADRFSPLVSRKNLILRAAEKTIFVWLTSVIIGGLFVIISLNFLIARVSDIADFAVALYMALLFGFLYSLLAAVPFFIFQYYSCMLFAKLWQRIAFLLAICYLITFLVISWFYSRDGFWGNDSDYYFAFIVLPYMAANTLAVIYSERRWR